MNCSGSRSSAIAADASHNIKIALNICNSYITQRMLQLKHVDGMRRAIQVQGPPLQRSQEIQHRLLIAGTKVEEVLHHRVGLRRRVLRTGRAWGWARAGARMLADRLEQIGGPAIVQVEQPLTQAPEWSRAELISAGQPLADPVCQAWAHVMDRKIGVGVN